MLKWLRKHGRPLARLGCVSIGTVYVLVGTFALFALSGRLIETADEDRIVYVLLGVPGGTAVIWTIVAGTSGYVVWRIIEVLVDPYDFGGDARGLATRAGVALSAAGYGFIAFSAARIALSDPSGAARDAAEEQQQLLIGQILQWPAGPWLVGAAGVIVIAVGLAQFALVFRRAYTTEIHLAPKTRGGERIIHVLAWYGYSARGVILVLLGYFLVRGAVSQDPSDVGDTDTAFDTVGGGLVGDTAFAIVALGTIAYGIFMYVNAWRYRFEAGTREPGVRRR